MTKLTREQKATRDILLAARAFNRRTMLKTSVLAGAAANLRDLNDLTSVLLAGILHLLASPPASNMLSRAAYLADGPAVAALDADED